jgi:hypothetical protein
MRSPFYSTPVALLLCLALACGHSAHGQYVSKGNLFTLLPFPIANLHDSLQPCISLQNPVRSLQTASSGSRLLGFAYNNFDEGDSTIHPTDSLVFVYSSGRGGDLTGYNPWKYDTAYGGEPNWAFPGSWWINRKAYQTFDSESRLLSMTLTVPGGSTGWTNNYMDVYEYNGDGLEQEFTELDWNTVDSQWQLDEQRQTSYNSDHLPVCIITKSWDHNGVLNYTGFDSFLYNATGQLAVHLSGDFDTLIHSGTAGWSMTYRYTPAGLLSEMTQWSSYWQSTGVPDRYHYNSANQIESKYVYTDDGFEIYEDSFVVDGHSPEGLPLKITQYRLDDNTSGVWQPMLAYVNTYTNLGLISSQTYQPLDTSYYRWRLLYRYNSIGQLTFENQESLVNGVWGHHNNNDYAAHYLYDLNNTAVQHSAITSLLHLEIIPVPADNRVSVHLELQHGQSFDASVTDMTGKVISQWKDISGNSYSKEISTAELANGVYLLNVHCKDGNNISKKFVVRH